MTNKTQEMYTYVINLFQKELKDKANKLENQRKIFASLAKFFKVVAIFGGTVAILTFLLVLLSFASMYLGFSQYAYPEGIIFYVLFIEVAVSFCGWFLHTILNNIFCSKVKNELYSLIYQSLDNNLIYYPGGFKLPTILTQIDNIFFKNNYGFDIDISELNPMLPFYHYIRVDDVITGSYEGHSIKIIEFSLIERHRTRTSEGRTNTTYIKVFQGVLLKTTMEKYINTQICINAKNSSTTHPSRFQKVNLESNEFEKLFDVYSTDQIESRYFFNTKMMDDFIKLRKITGNGISGFIDGNYVKILLHTSKDMFEPDINKPVNDPNTYFDVIYQAKTILDIITKLNLDSKTGL